MIGTNLVHLHVHSHFSLMEATGSIRDICASAKQHGYRALALTDTNNLYGLPAFLEACREVDLRPVIGAELRHGPEQVVALARNRDGYRNLCHLITLIQCNQLPEPLSRSLSEYAAGLIFISDSVPVLEHIFADGLEGYAEIIGFPGSLATYARKRSWPVVATNAVHLLTPGDYDLYKLLRAIHWNTSLSRIPESELRVADRWLWPPEHFHNMFEILPEALVNAAGIAAACHYQGDGKTVIFPKYDVIPDGMNAEQLLRALAYDGARDRYGKITEPVRQRLEKELAIINLKGFADYFLVVREIAQKATRICGRGSGAASLVCYTLGITNVDPIKHHLYFERFLNEGRKDPPDIDIDFCWDERDEILNWIFERFGRDRTAMVANHLTFQPRMAVRETAKVWGIPDGEITERTQRMPYFFHEAFDPATLTQSPRFREIDFPDPWPEILDAAGKLLKIPRHLSVHCGGVVITPHPITDYCPVQFSPKGIPILQWEKDGVEDMGFVKIDILSNRNGLPTVRDTLEMIRENEGVVIDHPNWDPTEDLATIAMLASGSNIGIFYVESPAMRQLQRKTEKGDFEHLVIHSSIIRPAANAFIHEYIRRLRALPEPPPSLHPQLDPILSESYGIMVYQEHVSMAAEALAGFSVEEADMLRRIMSKKDVHRRLQHYREKFRDGARENGICDDVIDAVWNMIASFAGYSFCKPHSASYAQVSYQSAYLRCHFPAEFLAAVLSNGGGYYTSFAYISEARRLGIQILSPDVNLSRVRYRGRRRKIRVGLMAIAGLREQAMTGIIEHREKHGRFTSVENLLQRVSLTQPEMKALIDAGACDAMEPKCTRSQLHWKSARWFFEHSGKPDTPMELPFDRKEGLASIPPPELPEYTHREMCKRQWQTLGYLLDCHPIELFRERLEGKKYVLACDFRKHIGEWVTAIGWHVTAKTVLTCNNEPMQFVSFEDTTQIYEAILFPKAYHRLIHKLDRMNLYLLKGRLTEEFHCVTFQVEDLERLLTDTHRIAATAGERS